MIQRRVEKVRKRDGRVVEYDEAKLADAIYGAARAAGQDNRYLAEDLAGVVTTYLERYHRSEIPTSDEIRRMVERILFETGHAEVARAYILYRESQGAPAPEAPGAPVGELFPSGPVLVEAATRDEVSAWGRDRITSALVKEAGLEPPIAEEIAAAVEQRIFREGHRRVSSILIRELVNQELLARGYASKMRRQLVVGLPKYDLDRLVRPSSESDRAADPEAISRLIGEITLKQYALQELHPREVADAHIEGRLHIHDLEHPLKFHWIAVEASEAAASAEDAPLLAELPARARTVGARLDARAVALAREASGGVELWGVNAAYAPFLGEAGDAELLEEAADLVVRLSRIGRPPVHLGLEIGPGGPMACFAREVARAARDLPGELAFSTTPESFSAETARAVLRESCRVAVERGRCRFVFEREAPSRRVSRFGYGGQGAGPFAIAQAVTINLPQAYYRSGPGSDFYAQLDASLDVAVRAHMVKRNLLRRLPPRLRDRGRAESSEYAVGVAGLNEAVALLCGSELSADENALRLGLRIVSFLYFRVREEAARHGLRLTLFGAEAPDVAERFLRIDREMFARARGLESQLGPMTGYTPGVHLHPLEGDPGAAISAEARFHTLMPHAAAPIPPAVRSSLSPTTLFDLLRHAATETLCAQVALP